MWLAAVAVLYGDALSIIAYPVTLTLNSFPQNDKSITTSTSISPPIPDNGRHTQAVSAIAEIELFLLRPPKPSSGTEALRVAKIPFLTPSASELQRFKVA